MQRAQEIIIKNKVRVYNYPQSVSLEELRPIKHIWEYIIQAQNEYSNKFEKNFQPHYTKIMVKRDNKPIRKQEKADIKVQFKNSLLLQLPWQLGSQRNKINKEPNKIFTSVIIKKKNFQSLSLAYIIY
ncbi:hypothetical protein TTHERM_00013390 (macronuclear) [Tetrahymena thermophila SB210]|uniref:Uncharacterized protein n=1 Tax=Tetrahymena thermophila (strain SB210) TaxID=312017 RepID=Q22RP9_TETTS|nr:hypothetical protein TTHERM_00013390 [Tetrahymena thermophila SB210]EAR88073.2 hypothetical protein TTHERM_00013390 [Tetrahymena thermophila SB210]|eukprot:XP_001008318.2 hypothetical protein TTHERM_00013390 [Tetrahymena thermophila SB210]